MIFSTRSCLFFFFFTLVLFSTLISARDTYSFDKFQREDPKDQNFNDHVPVQTNDTTDQDDQNPTFIPQTENGYGLYGHETTYNNNNNNNNNEEFNTRKYDENVNYDDSFSTSSLSQNQEPYNNYRDNYPYPKNMESYNDNNNKDTIYYGNSYGYGRERRDRESSYNGYSNNVERQGMSDTRFMANGNYYYDLDDDRNHGRFYQKHHYNYKPTSYNEKSNFENPYNSKNMMNQQSEMFGEEQVSQFTP